MATTKAPLFGLDASGALAGAIVFSKWRGRTYVRKLSIPANPKTGLQVGMRSALKFVTQNWASMSPTDQNSWTDLAHVDNITLLNAMVRYDQRLIRRNLGIWINPNAAADPTPTAVQTLAATAQPKTVVLTWTAPVTPGSFCTYIYRSTTTGFTVDVSNLIGIIPVAQLTFTDIDLITGTAYFYRVREGNKDGEFGALAAQVTATPL